jgi:hypothetical protein
VPWLSENPISGTVGADSVFDVAISFDSMTYTLGTYTATLRLTTQDPITPVVFVPVTMTITAASYPVYLPLIIKPKQTPLAPNFSLLGDGMLVGLVVVGMVGRWKRKI